jgi:hypothetical protein
MEKIIADSPSVSQWKERKIELAKKLKKFGIDIDNDTAMKVDEATMKSLLVEKARQGRAWSRLTTNFESWIIGCLLFSELYLILM